MSRYRVLLTQAARRDLRGLYEYFREHDSTVRAAKVIDRLLRALESLESLETQPARGAEPSELSALGLHAVRQIPCSPYRIIYRLSEREVLVMLIADGRRDMQSLLAERLLRTP